MENWKGEKKTCDKTEKHLYWKAGKGHMAAESLWKNWKETPYNTPLKRYYLRYEHQEVCKLTVVFQH